MDYKPDFLITPYQVIEDKNIAPSGERVYSVVYYYAKMKAEKCMASNKTIAEIAQISAGTVKNALSDLEKNGYIKRIYKTDKKMKRKEIIPLVAFRKASLNNDGGGHQIMTGGSSDSDHISNTNISNTNNNKKNNKKRIIDYFFEKKGYEMNDKEKKIVSKRYNKTAKNLSKIAGFKKIKEAIDIVAEWAESRDLEWTLQTVEKKWGEIDKMKPKKEKKKPYFRGQAMTKRNGQWFVMPEDGGQWLEFAGSEKDIEWK